MLKPRSVIRRAVIISILSGSLLLTLRIIGCEFSRPYIFGKSNNRELPRLKKGKLLTIKNKGRDVNGYLAIRGKRLVVLFHGRGTTIFHESFPARKLIQNGFSVLLFEYPGYGISNESEGTENNYYSDAELLIKHVQSTNKFLPKRSIAWGYSLGSGVAVEMSRRKLVSKVVLLSPHTSIPDLAAHRTLPILPHLLIWDRFDSKSKAQSIGEPVLIIHGEKDRTIPFSMGLKLHNEFENSTLIRLKNGNHQLFRFMGKNHWRQIFQFMRAPTNAK